jgi:hypothetical protein
MNCCAGHEACRVTVAGVERCFGETPPDEPCLPDLAPCAFSDECCCGLCAFDETGALVCCPEGTGCIEDGDPCTTDVDCCSGNCNESGFCGPDEVPCVELGGECETDEDCCGGYCSPTTHTCAVVPF